MGLVVKGDSVIGAPVGAVEGLTAGLIEVGALVDCVGMEVRTVGETEGTTVEGEFVIARFVGEAERADVVGFVVGVELGLAVGMEVGCEVGGVVGVELGMAVGDWVSKKTAG